MKKKILALALVLGLGLVAMPSYNVSAAGEDAAACDVEFLGLRPWYYGLTEGSDCKIKSPDTGCKAGDTGCDYTQASKGLAEFIWVIILNVLVDLFLIAGLVSLGFLLYGAYLFLRSGGDPNFAAKGRKTITAALVGLVVVTLANVISRLIVTIITAS